MFDFESITVHDETLSNSFSVTWVGKHVPISVSIASTLLSAPVFLCSENPMQLIREFLDELLKVSEQSATIMQKIFNNVLIQLDEKIQEIQTNFPGIESVEGSKRETGLFSAEAELVIEDKDSSYEMKVQKSKLRKLLNLKDEVNRYCKELAVFGFNSSRHDLNLIKDYLLKILLLERNCTPSVIRKSNQFIEMIFLGLQFLEILNFIAGSVNLDNFLEAYGMEEQKRYFPYEWFNSTEMLNNPFLPPIESFFSKLKNCNVLEKDFNDYQHLLSLGFEEGDAQKKLKLRERPITKEKNYNSIQCLWQEAGMRNFKDYLQWYNNKDVVPLLNALQKGKVLS